MTDDHLKRRFEFKKGSAYKYWTVEQRRRTVTITSGRIGHNNTPLSQSFDSVESASLFVDRKIESKLKEGYKEIHKKEIARKSNSELWQDLVTHEPFLKAIMDSPDSRDGYLIYADWLMDRGDIRGEFIHCQLKIDAYGTPLWELEKLEKRSAEIQSANIRTWLGELGKFISDSSMTARFARGFLDSVSISHLSEPMADSLTKSPHFRLIRDLQILDINSNVTEDSNAKFREGLSVLASVAYPNLKSFTPGQRAAVLGGWSVIQMMESMPRLEKLRLNNLFPRKTLTKLMQLEVPNLTHLEIVDRAGDATVRRLAESHWLEQLQIIDLQCKLSEASCEILAGHIDPGSLETLYVSEDLVGSRSIDMFERYEINVITN